jgi:hypothetical protein
MHDSPVSNEHAFVSVRRMKSGNMPKRAECWDAGNRTHEMDARKIAYRNYRLHFMSLSNLLCHWQTHTGNESRV